MTSLRALGALFLGLCVLSAGSCLGPTPTQAEFTSHSGYVLRLGTELPVENVKIYEGEVHKENLMGTTNNRGYFKVSLPLRVEVGRRIIMIHEAYAHILMSRQKFLGLNKFEMARDLKNP